MWITRELQRQAQLPQAFQAIDRFLISLHKASFRHLVYARHPGLSRWRAITPLSRGERTYAQQRSPRL
ncbi:hypothetical protein EMIT047CA2_250060 [Pseudomonas soli]